VPTFCRHNRLLLNCPICAREQDLEVRPVVSSSTPGAREGGSSGVRGGTGHSSGAGSATGARAGGSASASRRRPAHGRRGDGLTVRRLTRGADDGYYSDLVPGLRSSADALRLAEELAWAWARLRALGEDPPGLYAEVARPDRDLEERSWLAFLIAFIGPHDGPEPFAAIEAARTSWASGELADVSQLQAGPRGALEPDRGQRTLEAYRSWASRAGSQQQAFTGELGWAPERRFARVLERLALPGFPRGARFELLTVLGQTGVYAMQPAALALGGSDFVTVAAKRLLGIGDPMLLERRAAGLAAACELPLAALDTAFFNWERGQRATLGMGEELAADPDALALARAALGF
jgi:hypothetical protein